MENIYLAIAEEFFGNSIRSYLIALIVFGGSYGALKLFRAHAVKRLQRLAEQTKGDFDDLIMEVISVLDWPLYFLISAAVALQFVVLIERIEKGIVFLTFIALAFYAGKAATRVIEYIFQKGVQSVFH